MTIHLRPSEDADLPFMKEMLYEAVFWRRDDKRPSFEEAFTDFPGVIKALANWSEREGDTAVIATQNGTPVGAAWYRYWTEENYLRGYMDDNVPVLVIGIHEDHRHQGIGTMLIAWLVEQAKKGGIQQMSLMVAMDNYALNLYQQQGFQKYSKDEDSFTMVREI